MIVAVADLAVVFVEVIVEVVPVEPVVEVIV